MKVFCKIFLAIVDMMDFDFKWPGKLFIMCIVLHTYKYMYNLHNNTLQHNIINNIIINRNWYDNVIFESLYLPGNVNPL